MYLPKLTVKAGVPTRLRVVNGNAHRYLGMYGFPSECELYTIAADGIYYDSPRSVSHGYVFVSIGSRVDLLIQVRLLLL